MTSGSARDDVLARVRTALAGRRAAHAVPRDYRAAGEAAVVDPIGLLCDRLVDYGAAVQRCAAGDVSAAVAAALAEHGARIVVVAAGVDGRWAAAVPVPLFDEPPLPTAALDGADGVLTGVAVAIAETGTLVLDSGQGRRALTLLPDLHLAVVRAEQIVASVPDAIAALDATRAQTWISGPSATSDIELQRVEGVHGPRRLHVIVVEAS